MRKSLTVQGAVVLYWMVTGVGALMAFAMAGGEGAWSAAIGGGAVASASTLFAVWLAAHREAIGKGFGGGGTLLLGAWIKLISAGGLMYAAVELLQREGVLVWPAFLGGVFLTANAPLIGFILFSVGRNYGGFGFRANGV
ncbi:MAG: ATP synthase subunit I [Hydrogenophilus sp.]|nr:ATP synthase subunit I [Hydrogenophilus sp.]